MKNRQILELLNATESAAISCHGFIGKGDEKAADQAAVDAMRNSLNSQEIFAEIVIGEGERDKAPMLHIGEILGILKNDLEMPKLEIALDPLEGTTICANAGFGALSVMAVSEKNGFLNAPDVYMEKIAIAKIQDSTKDQIIDLDHSVQENLKNLSIVKKCAISDLTVTILDRPRHGELIAKSREAGAKVKLIQDGDISAIIALNFKNSQSDMYVGTGGAPEGVLAASALQTMGGQIMGRLKFQNDEEKNRAKYWGISDFTKKYVLNDLVSKPSIFFASGVTNGEMLEGVKKIDGHFHVNSIIINNLENSVRYLNSAIKI